MKQTEYVLFLTLLGSWGLLAAGISISLISWLLSAKRSMRQRRWRDCLAKLRFRGWHLIERVRVLSIQASIAYWRHYRPTPVQFLVSDERMERELKPCIRLGLRRLARATGVKLPPDAVVMVQRTISRQGSADGYNHELTLPGGRRVLLRLALEVDGTVRTADQVLAALAEQYIELVAPSAVQGESAAESSENEFAARRPHLLVVTQSGDSASSGSGPHEVAATTPAATVRGDPLLAPAKPVEKAG